MAKIPVHPEDLFPEVIEDTKALFGDDLVSIILYGSATGKDYRPGKSDINFMIVLSETGIEELHLALGTVKKWKKRRVATPLFLSKFYIESSMDVFPVEYLNFQSNHRVVYGEDVLKDLSFDPELLRLQCEREIKGKLLLLREAYLESAGKAKALKDVISRSIGTFAAIFKALLFLKGEEGPSETREIIKISCRVFNLEASVFERLLDVKLEKEKPRDEEMQKLYKDYLREVRSLSKRINAIGG
jgi:predicted nucleotidyltransferase